MIALGLAACGNEGTVEVRAFPAPETRAVAPGTTFSFRGASAEEIEGAGEIEVVGSRSGAHPGELVPHPDGEGASFIPDEEFEPGERISVRTAMEVRRAEDGDFRLRISEEGTPGEPSSPENPPLEPKDSRRFRSLPRVSMPTLTVDEEAHNTAPGHLFLSPKRGGKQGSVMIADNEGEPVWFQPMESGLANDFRVQEYKGEQVLTWWQGRSIRGYGIGEMKILDSSYQEVATVAMGNGYGADLHDCVITPEGTALLMAYHQVRRDLSPFGGPKRGTVTDSIVQEVDIETGLVLFEWHSYGNAGLDETDRELTDDPKDPYDYFHVNAVEVDSDGNLLVTARRPSAVYKIDRETGAIIWRLGGKESDFGLGEGVEFIKQHDARRHPDGTISIFDNRSQPPDGETSRGILLEVDEDAMAVELVRAFEHPEGIYSRSQGGVHMQPNGNALVGWGSDPHLTEFSAEGDVLFDAQLPPGFNSYRAYRFEWTGRPQDDPAIAAERTGDGELTVHASWNGATEVASWEVLAGPGADSLEPVETADRDGFETEIEVVSEEPFVAVRALDAVGEELGASEAIEPEEQRS